MTDSKHFPRSPLLQIVIRENTGVNYYWSKVSWQTTTEAARSVSELDVFSYKVGSSHLVTRRIRIHQSMTMQEPIHLQGSYSLAHQFAVIMPVKASPIYSTNIQSLLVKMAHRLSRQSHRIPNSKPLFYTSINTWGNKPTN